MTWTIPNTFIAGTKAKSGEVNQNFTSLKQFVDTLETNQATNTTDILQLEENKADLNGSNEQRFQVADATNSFDAINKQTLLNLISNTQDVIKGFTLSKFNNNTISATAGNCYDSTFKYMIVSNTSLSKAQSNLSANAQYYVYVCADKDTNTCQLVISLSNTTPELPGGYEYFRQLGYFITDDSSNISTVVTLSTGYTGNMNPNNNGWCKLPNGLQLVWGYTDNVNPSSDKIVSFYNSFSTYCFVVMLTPISYGGRSGQNGDKMGQQAMVTARSNTQFTVHNFGEQVYVNYAYLAIGM